MPALARILAGLVVVTLGLVPGPAYAAPPSLPATPSSVIPRAASIFSGQLGGYQSAIDGEGRISIAYESAESVYVIQSGPDGKSWGASQALGKGGTIHSINANIGGDLVVSWISQGKPLVSIKTKADKAWRSYTLESGTAYLGARGAMVLPDGTTVVMWLDSSNYEGKLWTSTISKAGVTTENLLVESNVTAGAKLLSNAAGQPMLFYGSGELTYVRSYQTGFWSAPVAVCSCLTESAAFAGGGRYLLKTYGGALAVYSSAQGQAKEYAIPSGRLIAGGGGRVWSAWSVNDDRLGAVRIAELDLTTGRFVSEREVARYNLDPGLPNADWPRNTVASPDLVVDSNGQPTVAWFYSVWVKVDDFLPSFMSPRASPTGAALSTRRAIPQEDNPYNDYYVYIATGETGAPKLVSRELPYGDTLVTGPSGTTVYLWNEPLAYPNSRLLAEVLGKSEDNGCVSVPADGGPIQQSVAPGPRGANLESRKALRFYSMEAVGCFEPITEASHKWGKGWERKGVWVNAADTTRINGVDFLAQPGTILFDANNKRINWLPGATVAMGLQGKEFNSFVAPGTLKDPYSMQITAGRTVLNIGAAFRDDKGVNTAIRIPKPKAGGKQAQLLGMPVVPGVGVYLEWGVDGAFETGGEGGYTQVRASLGFVGVLNPEEEEMLQRKPNQTCSWDERNSIAKGSSTTTVKGRKITSDRYLRCELAAIGGPGGIVMRWKLLPHGAISPGISATFRTTNKSGLQLREVKGTIPHLAVGPFSLDDVELSYSPATDTRGSVWSAKASGGLSFGGGAGVEYKATVGFSIQLVDASKGLWDSWKIQGFTLGVEAKIPTGGPTYIRRLLGTVDYGDQLGGASMSGNVTWALGNPLPIGAETFDPLSIDATLTYTDAIKRNPSDPTSSAQPAKFALQGTGAIFGMPLADMTAEAELAGSFPAAVNRLSLEATADLQRIPWPLPSLLSLKGSAKLTGFYDWRDYTWQVQGTVRDMNWGLFTLATGVDGGDVLFSDRGWAICANTKDATFGASGSWTSFDDIKTYSSNCDVGVMKSIPKTPKQQPREWHGV